MIGDHPAGCSMQSGGSAQYGEGYWDLVNHYGGDWYSICASDWGVQLQNMANNIAGRMSYTLSESDPIESTISVYVNGQLTTDWTYDSSLNCITFNSDSIPEAGQTIRIEYATWGC